MSPSDASNRTQTDVNEELLNKDIAEMYDESTDFFEHIWGDHIHHGFYDVGVDNVTVPLASALIRIVDESLLFAGLSGKKPERIVDVGCGIGGSTRHIGKEFGAKIIGVTNSPVQVQRAQALTADQGLAELVTFQVGDALNLSFPDGHFDLVWSMECGEHMPDRAKYLSELVRVAAPGGTIIITASCHRDLGPDEKSLKPDEQELLDQLCKSLHLPDWCSGAHYVNLFQSLNVQDIKRADWSENTDPFWPAVFSTPLKWESVISLLRSGPKSQEFVLNMSLMYDGHKQDVIKYNIITCKKPE